MFGDSLSDAGNLAQSMGLPAGSSFTTNPDPVWSNRVAETFGASGAPSLAGGPIHAWGGACVNPEGPCRFQVPTLAAQVSGYLSAQPAGRADPNALYVVWGGGNDISSVLAGSADPQALQSGTVAAAGALVAQVQALRDAGARHVVVLNLPDLGLAPIARRAGTLDPRVPATLSALTDAYNAALAAGVRTHEDGIVPIDVHGLLDELIEDPGRYGFTDIHGTACSPGTNALRMRSKGLRYSRDLCPRSQSELLVRGRQSSERRGACDDRQRGHVHAHRSGPRVPCRRGRRRDGRPSP